MYTREAFGQQREAAERLEDRESRTLAGFAVGLGVAQLAFGWWAERYMARPSRLALTGAMFVAYLVLVVWLIWRRTTRLQAAAPACPQCGAKLQGMSLRVTATTGKCDRCGGQVIIAPAAPY